MKTTPVNFIGYGDWGSRLANKVVQEGFTIENLVTNRDSTNVLVEHNNLIKRENIESIDWTLPTFITTGPLYHHEILKQAKCRCFVEKPYYIYGQAQTELEFQPYVNYHWYNSLRLRIIKNMIGYNWEHLVVDIFTTTRIERGFSTLEDFLPHIVSIADFINPNVIYSHEVTKISDDVYHVELDYGFNKITFKFGKSDIRYSRFKTEDCNILITSANTFEHKGTEFTVDRDPLGESIHRYLQYHEIGSCDRVFFSEDFHKRVLEIGS